jgi:hypothetical protein
VGEEQENALQELKKAVLSNAVLIYPRMDKQFVLFVDASRAALGNVLMQEVDGQLRAVCFGSRATRNYEKNYSPVELELIALLFAISSYHSFLSNGIPYIVKTDHLSLKYIQNLKHGSAKLIRYSLLLQDQHFSWNTCRDPGIL